MRRTSPLWLPAGLLGMLALRHVKRRLTPLLDLSGRVAVVTGGTRGLGFLIARELARAGCRVVISGRSETELSRARDRLRLEGSPIWTVVADQSVKEQAEHVITEARRAFGGVDILVNNAGIIQVGPLETFSHEQFRQSMDLMYWGALNASLAVIPHFKARGSGAIVNITSIGGVIAVPHLLPYVAAKFAAVGLSQGLHAELRRYNVHVTTVVPSTMRTGSHGRAFFGGQAGKEYTWFKLGAALPGVSTDAERAARRIVLGLRRREPFVTIGWPTPLALRFQALFPTTTQKSLALLNRLLPGPPPLPHTPLVEGRQVEAQGRPLVFEAVTTLGNRAERRLQEHGAL